MRRPFAVRLSSSAPDAVLQARIEFIVPLADEFAARAVKVGQQFFELANAGALCGDRLAPAASGIGSSKLTHADSHVDWLFTEVAIDPLSIHVLLNMVHALHENFAKVRSVHVTWPLLREVDHATQASFPKISAPLPFPFSYDPDATSFDIALDFDSPQDEAVVEAINETLGCWLRAVFCGAYGDESSPPQINRVRFDTEAPCTLDTDSLVWAIERFQSTSFALAGMVNVVSRIHHTLAPIQRLYIGE